MTEDLNCHLPEEIKNILPSFQALIPDRFCFLSHLQTHLSKALHFRSIINVLTLFYAEKKPSHAVKSVAGI
jgi:hypothetical protein